jgi:hypothetical protein
MSIARGPTLRAQVRAVRSTPRLRPNIGSGLESNKNKSNTRNIASRNRNGEKSAAKSEEKETSSWLAWITAVPPTGRMRSER